MFLLFTIINKSELSNSSLSVCTRDFCRIKLDIIFEALEVQCKSRSLKLGAISARFVAARSRVFGTCPLIHNQLVCRLPIGILNLWSLFESFLPNGPEEPQREGVTFRFPIVRLPNRVSHKHFKTFRFQCPTSPADSNEELLTTYSLLGLQHDTIHNKQPFGVPLAEKLLPQYLRQLGYSTHAVGKVGFSKLKVKSSQTVLSCNPAVHISSQSIKQTANNL